MKRVVCLEEHRRWGTGLDRISGSVGLSQKERGDQRLCSKEQYREKRSPCLCHRRVLHQEEDETVRTRRRMLSRRMMTILGVMVLLGMQFGEVMHQVWTRHRQQRQERQDGPERDAALSPPQYVRPPLFTAGPEGMHLYRSVVIALSLCRQSILVCRLLGSKSRSPDTGGVGCIWVKARKGI